MKTRIQQIRARLDAATPGPWFISGDVNGENLNIIQTNHTTRDVWQIPRVKGDYELIANSRQDISDLLAVVEVYEAGLKSISTLDKFKHLHVVNGAQEALTKAHEIMNELQGMR